MKVTLTCDNCGKNFERAGSSKSIRKFCSRDCSYKGLQQLWSDEKTMFRYMYGHAARGAKSRKLDFTITLDDIISMWDSQEGLCKLTGVSLKIADTRRQKQMAGYTTASLDRINSNKGYTRDNVQIVHVKVNEMKMRTDQYLFICWCNAVAAKTPVENPLAALDSLDHSCYNRDSGQADHLVPF